MSQIENEIFSADISVSMSQKEFENYEIICQKSKYWDLLQKINEKRYINCLQLNHILKK